MPMYMEGGQLEHGYVHNTVSLVNTPNSLVLYVQGCIVLYGEHTISSSENTHVPTL